MHLGRAGPALSGRLRRSDRGGNRPRRYRRGRGYGAAGPSHRLRARHAVHHRGVGGLRGGARAPAAYGRRADLPSFGRQRSRRDSAQACTCVPPGPRRRLAASRHRSEGVLPRQHPRGAGCLRPGAAPSPVRAVAGTGHTCPRRLRIPVPLPEPPQWVRSVARGAARPSHPRPRTRDRGLLHRRAGRRCHARSGRSLRRLLAGRAGNVPPPRRAPDRRRGDDRVRPNRTLVRL